MVTLKGIYPILATPFSNNGDVDYESLKQLVTYLSDTGIHGITMFGIASEFHKLTDLEKEKMLDVVTETISKEKSLIVSITDQSWEVAVDRAKKAEWAGANALMMFPPFFMNPSKKEIENHIIKVASAVNLPVIIQYAPNQSGVNFEPAFFTKLNEIVSNIHYVKVECVPPGPMITDIKENAEGRLSSLIGYAGIQMIDALSRGAAGVQPGCSFVEVYVDIYNYFVRGEIDKAVETHKKILPLLNLLMQNVELLIQAEKNILYKRGIIATPYCRSPKYTLDSLEKEQVEKYIEPLKPYFQFYN